MINAAIVGMGRWGQTLVDSIAGGSDALRFIAGTTRTHSKVEDYAAGKGLRLYATLDELLSVEEIDAVVLATPHTVHFGQIMAAAAAGKHVYCEKPFCLTGAEATTALDALAAQGLKVAVGHNRRFFPNTIALKRILETGALGEMVQIDGNFSDNLAAQANTWRANRQESPAGSMTSLGIHVIDMFIHLLGRIEYVQTISRRVAMPYDVDDTTVVLLRFSSGQLGCLGTVACTGRLWQVRAFGTAGWAEIVDHHRMIVPKDKSRTPNRGVGRVGLSVPAVGRRRAGGVCTRLRGGRSLSGNPQPDPPRHGRAGSYREIRGDRPGCRRRLIHSIQRDADHDAAHRLAQFEIVAGAVPMTIVAVDARLWRQPRQHRPP